MRAVEQENVYDVLKGEERWMQWTLNERESHFWVGKFGNRQISLEFYGNE